MTKLRAAAHKLYVKLIIQPLMKKVEPYIIMQEMEEMKIYRQEAERLGCFSPRREENVALAPLPPDTPLQSFR